MDELILELEEKVAVIEEKDARIERLSKIIINLTTKCEQLKKVNTALLSRKSSGESSKSCVEDSFLPLPEPLDLP